MDHVKSHDLADYALRNEFAIADSRRRDIEQHVRECHECEEKLKVMEHRAAQSRRDAGTHLRELLTRTAPRRRFFIGWPITARIAAVFAVCLVGYGAAVYVVNYRFDHGPMGLAEFQADYEFAIRPSVTRGNEKEPEDIRLFKEGVRTLFDSKQTTLGLFPRYDEASLDKAQKLLSAVIERTSDPDLKRLATRVYDKTAQLR